MMGGGERAAITCVLSSSQNYSDDGFSQLVYVTANPNAAQNNGQKIRKVAKEKELGTAGGNLPSP